MYVVQNLGQKVHVRYINGLKYKYSTIPAFSPKASTVLASECFFSNSACLFVAVEDRLDEVPSGLTARELEDDGEQYLA